MTGTSTSPPTTLGSAPSMPATTMMTRAAIEAVVFAEQPVEAGDADVVQPIDRVAHDLGGDGRFLGDRQVGRAGGGDQDRAAARRRRLPMRRVIVRASSWNDARGQRLAHGVEAPRGWCASRAGCGPRPTIRSAMAAIWAGVLPWPKTTSGNPWRSCAGGRPGRSPGPRTALAQNIEASRLVRRLRCQARRDAPSSSRSRSCRRFMASSARVALTCGPAELYNYRL